MSPAQKDLQGYDIIGENARDSISRATLSEDARRLAAGTEGGSVLVLNLIGMTPSTPTYLRGTGTLVMV